MYPEANIPVTQLSIQQNFSTSYHLQLGRTLAPLRQEGILILASGTTTHNLRAFGQYDFDATPPEWVQGFDDWLADWCITTLFGFDLAYYGRFKCNIKRLVEYPNLWNYLRDLYQQPGVKQMCSADHVKQLYYAGLPELNPNRVIPVGPEIDFDLPLFN